MISADFEVFTHTTAHWMTSAPINDMFRLAFSLEIRLTLLDSLKDNPFVLAPMAGITDSPFRSFMKDMGCGIVISELVSAHGLKHGNEPTLKLARFRAEERPVGIQIFGEDAEILSFAARFVEEQGADFVDINLGCPVPKVVKKGAGSALLRNPCELHKILAIVKKAIQIPLTIKIRTGWDAQSINASEVVQAAADAGVTWVAIHGRTRAQGYSGQADWDFIKKVKASSPIPIIGNGDIHSAKQAVTRLETSGCDGVMIGRGCLKNPWIFRQATDLLRSHKETMEDPFDVVLGRLKNSLENWKDDRYTMLQMKKFTAWFSAGYPSSQSFRKNVFACKTADEVLDLSSDYFGKFSLSSQTDTSHEPFLMGGHG